MLELVEIKKVINFKDIGCESYQMNTYITPDGTEWDYLEDALLFMLNERGVIVEVK